MKRRTIWFSGGAPFSGTPPARGGRRAGLTPGRRRETPPEMGVGLIFPCAYCGAADSRDEKHQGGCPEFPPLPKAEMMRIARSCERGWEESEISERERAAEREKQRADRAYRVFLGARRAERGILRDMKRDKRGAAAGVMK